MQKSNALLITAFIQEIGHANPFPATATLADLAAGSYISTKVRDARGKLVHLKVAAIWRARFTSRKLRATVSPSAAMLRHVDELI
jgi:hypothetical protein